MDNTTRPPEENDDAFQTDEYSESGQPVYRHDAPKAEFTPATGSTDTIGAVEAHIRRWVGEPNIVWHEIVSHLVHIDVHVVPSSPERPFITLVTSGMSDRAMHTPRGAETLTHCELYIQLPRNWHIPESFTIAGGSFQGDPTLRRQQEAETNRWYWPVRLLKYLARFPHEYDTWLWHGHTIPNGDPPEPMAEGTALCCAALAFPVAFDEGFQQLELADRTIHFWNVILLYREEMEYKLKHGMNALYDLFDAAGFSPVLDMTRPNVCAVPGR